MQRTAAVAPSSARPWLPARCCLRPPQLQPAAGRQWAGVPERRPPARPLLAVKAAVVSAMASGGSAAGAEPLCPLHACLLEFGVADLAPFSKPHHLKLSEERVERDVRPKLLALRAHGLWPAQMGALLSQTGGRMLTSSYGDCFGPNLALLRDILDHRDYVPHPEQPQLTAAGKWLAGQPQNAAAFLCRDPRRVKELVEWAEARLGLSRSDLAGSSSLVLALLSSTESAEEVRGLFAGLGCNREAMAALFMAAPTLFGSEPATLSAKLAFLARQLELDLVGTLSFVLRSPVNISRNLEASLPGLLSFLDEYMGEAGTGCRLLLKEPTLGTTTRLRAQREVAAMEGMGFSKAEVQAMINDKPSLLINNAASAVHQQKRDWFVQVLGRSADDYNSNTRLRTASLRRLASRHDFMVQHGMRLWAIGSLAKHSDAVFAARIGKKLGRELSVGEWRAWVRAWLDTESGKRWGFPPLAK